MLELLQFTDALLVLLFGERATLPRLGQAREGQGLVEYGIGAIVLVLGGIAIYTAYRTGLLTNANRIVQLIAGQN